MRNASTAPRALLLLSLGNKTVSMGAMVNMLAVWSLSCRLLLPMNKMTLVRELVYESVGYHVEVEFSAAMKGCSAFDCTKYRRRIYVRYHYSKHIKWKRSCPLAVRRSQVDHKHITYHGPISYYPGPMFVSSFYLILARNIGRLPSCMAGLPKSRNKTNCRTDPACLYETTSLNQGWSKISTADGRFTGS